MEISAKIFLVEDEILSAMVLTTQLKHMGFTVPKSVSTGEDAIEGARIEKPDLILMDINLIGEMDGITAARRIKAEREVPVIFITGYSDSEVMARANETLPAAFFIKPLDFNRLKLEILKVLGENIQEF